MALVSLTADELYAMIVAQSPPTTLSDEAKADAKRTAELIWKGAAADIRAWKLHEDDAVYHWSTPYHMRGKSAIYWHHVQREFCAAHPDVHCTVFDTGSTVLRIKPSKPAASEEALADSDE